MNIVTRMMGLAGITLMLCLPAHGQSQVSGKSLDARMTPLERIVSTSPARSDQLYPALVHTTLNRVTTIPSFKKKGVQVIGLDNKKKNTTAARRAVPKAPSLPEGMQLWGHVVSSNDWNYWDAQYGIYSFGLKDLKREPLFTSWNSWYSSLSANGGSVYFDGVFHFTTYSDNWNGKAIYYNEINTDNWTAVEPLDREPGSDLSFVVLAGSYDPKSGKVYAFTPNQDATAWQFSTVDYTAMKSTAIAACDTGFVAVACNSAGDLFGISRGGSLFSVDKTTAAISLIGKTGVLPASLLQSAAFDQRTGKLYWAAMEGTEGNYTSALYEVDTKTGAAAKVLDFPHGEELASLVVFSAPDAKSPAMATNLSTDFVPSSNTGKILFTIPTVTYDGSLLTGEVNYTVKANSKIVATGTAMPGADVVLSDITLTQGENQIVVELANSYGSSQRATLNTWIGYDDKPVALSNLKYEIVNGNKVKLSWSPVTKGIHGGSLNPDEMTYEITRYPGYFILASGIKDTTFTDVVSLDTLKKYKYFVTPMAGDTRGDDGIVSFYLGHVFSVPYFENFNQDGSLGGTNYDGFDTYTVIDANHDGCTYVSNDSYWGGYASYSPSKENAADDWLITPPIKMEPGNIYNLRFSAGGRTDYPDVLEIKLGTDTVVSSFKTTIMPATATDASFNGKERRRFTVDKAGEYRIGFHNITQAGLLYGGDIDNVEVIVEAGGADPDSVTALSVVPGPKGEQTADISFVTPVSTVDGKPLAGIDSVQIWCNDAAIYTIKAPAAGKAYSYKAKASRENDDNKFSVVAFAGGHSGIVAEKTIFVGNDAPLPPRNLAITDNLDGTAHVTWDPAPDYGRWGGYVDPASLTYTAWRRDVTRDPLDGMILINDKVQAENIKGTETDVTLPGADILGSTEQRAYQNFFVKTISSYYPTFPSDEGTVPVIFVGDNYTLPFHEGFKNSGLERLWISKGNSEYAWFLSKGLSSDGDNGCAAFSTVTPGDEASLTSGKIELGKAAHPMLIFRYYALPGADLKLRLNIDENNKQLGAEDAVWNLDFNSDTHDEGWVPVAIDLSKYAGKGYISLRFTGTINETKLPILIDDVNVRDVKDNDLRLALLQTPSHITAGQSFNVTVALENYGLFEASDYTVSVFANGKKVAESTATTPLQPNYYDNVTLSIPTKVTDKEMVLSAEVTYEVDDDATNNVSAKDTIALKTPDYLTVDDLAATANDDGGVDLSWTAPANDGSTTITESFEDYDTYITDGIGQWTTVDGDKQPTYGFADNVGSFPHMNEPMAYITFNTADFGLNPTKYPGYYAHSGNQFLACFSGATEGKRNDDWLISPVLSGNAQTIKFFAKSWTAEYGGEEFEVLYSTTDTRPESFTKLGKTVEAPDSAWTEYSVALPQGAKYFAIHCVSLNKFILMIDDITYQPGAFNITGYNIYRDGDKVGETAGEATTYADKTVPDGNHSYNVTVVYTIGESAMSNTASILLNAIHSQTTGAASVKALSRTIRISNAEGATVKIFSADGKNIFEGPGQKQMDVRAGSGVYIVSVGEKTYSVLVK